MTERAGGSKPPFLFHGDIPDVDNNHQIRKSCGRCQTRDAKFKYLTLAQGWVYLCEKCTKDPLFFR